MALGLPIRRQWTFVAYTSVRVAEGGAVLQPSLRKLWVAAQGKMVDRDKMKFLLLIRSKNQSL